MIEQLLSDAKTGITDADLRCILARAEGVEPPALRSLAEVPTIDDDLAMGARLINLRNGIAATARNSGVDLTPGEQIFLGALDTEMLELFMRLWCQVVAGAERINSSVQ